MVSITDTINSNGPWNTSYYSSDFKHKGSSNRKINIDLKTNDSDSLALFKTIKNQRYRQALLLLQGGIDVNGRNETGETPLIYLSKALNRRENKKMRQKFAKMLLDMGANPNIQDFRGITPLMMASIKGQEDLVQTFLADNNTDITIQDREGNTALMHAARLGYIPVVQAFIANFLRRELDASLLRQRNNQGKNALELAKEEGKTECARLMTNFLTQFNETLNEDSMKRIHMQNTLIPKVKSLDSIHMDKDALVFHSIMNGYSREDSDCDYHRDTRSDGFESALRNRIEHLQQTNSRRFTEDPSDFYEEIWQQETVSWFNGDKDSSKSGPKQFSDRMNNNMVEKKSNKSAESVKLPPIGHRKLVDYKTWCELGNKIKEKRNH